MPRFRVTLLAAVTAVLPACDGSEPLRPELPLGSITGRVLEAPAGLPAPDALVVLHPTERSTRTDADGRFAFHGLEIRGDESVYAVITVRNGETASEWVTLSRSAPVASVDIVIPDPAERPVEGLDVRSTPRFDTGPISFDIDVSNAREGDVTGLVVRDTLDAIFGTVVTAEAIEVDREAFPDAEVVIDAGRRSFSVTVPTLGPTDGFVRLYTLTVPRPPPAVACNVVLAEGRTPAGSVAAEDISCLVT